MNNDFFPTGVAGVDRVSYDLGLRQHMQRVFNYMAGGLALTGALAFAVANTALKEIIFGTPLVWLFILAPLGFMLVMSFKFQTISASSLKMMFWAFCGTMGVSLASVFIMYTNESVARAFFITGAMFGATSLWGYTTKRDLSGMGSFLMMGVIGLVIAGVVNLFLQSTGLQWLTSVLTVIIFTGLTAYDVQRIKENYAENWGTEANDKLAVFGALSLYMNFINAFRAILELTGALRKE